MKYRWLHRPILAVLAIITILLMAVAPVLAADSVILGVDGGGASNSGANYVTFTRTQAAANYVAHSLRTYSAGAGNIKIALYNGNSTMPTTLITSTSGACSAASYNTFTIADVNIISGNYYWIGAVEDAAGVTTYDASGATRSYKAATYGTYSYPATFDHSGFTDDAVKEHLAVMGVSASAPTVSTLAATSVTDTSAIIGGNITASVPVITGYGTQYGMASSYGSWINSTVSQSAPFTFQNTTPALNQGKLYYFRAWAKNFVGEGYGSQATFLTLPDAPTAFTCTSLNTTAVTLAWTNGVGSSYTPIWYKTTGYPATPTDGTLACNTTSSSYILNGLDNTLTYYFSAWGWTSNSTLSAYSSTFAQASGAPFGVAVISTDRCSGFTRNSAILNAHLVSTPDTVLEYGFDYGVDTSYGTQITQTGTLAVGESYWMNLPNLTAGSVYHYRAKVRIAAGWGYGLDHVFNTQGSPVTWEYLNTGGDSDSAPIYYSNMTAMQFTVGTQSHTITSIRIPLKKVGTTPGTATLTLYHADGANKPTGDPLATGTLDANFISSSAYTWYSFQLNVETNVQAAQKYACVVQAQGDSANYILWECVAGGGLANAISSNSVDAGISWSVAATKDAMIEVWGNSAIQVLDAKVFQNYAGTGDWLVCAEVQDTYLPYYPNSDPSIYFRVDLMRGTTSVASTSLKEFGRRPIAILLNASTAGTLTWLDSTMKVRVTLNTDATQYSEYALTTPDWQAGGNTYLDNWVRYTAGDIQTYDTAITGTQQQYLIQTSTALQLTYSGGQMYTTGIPRIMEIRPNLFQIVTTTLTHTETPVVAAFDAGTDVSAKIGSPLYSMFDNIGQTLFGFTGKDLLGDIIWGVYIFLVVGLFAGGKGGKPFVIAAGIAGLAVMFVGLEMGVIDRGMFAMIGIVSAMIVAYGIFARNAA
jgi:hypothetical protein